MPARGLAYLELSALSARTDRLYDASGAGVPFRRLGDADRPTLFRDRALVVYAEAGLGGGFALEGDVAFKRITVEEPATLFRSSGPADLRLALKRAVLAGGPVVLAVSAGAKVPLGHDPADYPALGSGSIDVALGAHAGAGWGGGGWAQAELGARRRGGPARDEWPFAVQAGLPLSSRVTAIADLRGHGRLRGPGDVDASFDPALATSSVVAAGPGLAFAPTRSLRIGLQAWRPLSGRNVPAGWKWKLALARVRG